MSTIVYTTEIPKKIVDTYNKWQNLPEGIAKNAKYLVFANLCEKENKTPLHVIEQINS